MSPNNQEFIDLFNLIDEWITTRGGFDRSAPFFHKIKELAATDYFYAYLSPQLSKIANLRNFIVHSPHLDGQPLAVPSIALIDRMKEIYAQMRHPPSVAQDRFIFEVFGADVDEDTARILSQMDTLNFSQFPVFEHGQVIELISTNTIARWVSRNLDAEGRLPSKALKVRDLMSCIEFEKNYKFISQETDIYEASSHFLQTITERKRNLDALFITKTGSPLEPLLGLVTIEDIAPYIK